MPRKPTKRHDPAEDISTVVVPVRIPPADKVEAERQAKADRRPLSQFLRNLIHDGLWPKRTIR